MIKTVLKKVHIFLKNIKRNFLSWKVRKRCGSCGERLRVNFKTIVTKNTVLGNNVNFNGMEISGGGNVKIGNYFHSGKNCHIITSVHDYDHGNAIPYDRNNFIHKNVTIEDCVWIGDGVNILGGVTIHEGAIIQAYSTVVNDIPKYSIAGGHPAKVFKQRNIDHYEMLKNKREFH